MGAAVQNYSRYADLASVVFEPCSQIFKHFQHFQRICEHFIGALAKLRKATIGSVMSVCPYVHFKQLGSHWRDFHEIWYECFSNICIENSSFINILQEQRVHYVKNNIHISSYLPQFFLEWEIFQINLVQKIKIVHFQYNFFPENRAVYDVMWKNIVDRVRPQMTV